MTVSGHRAAITALDRISNEAGPGGCAEDVVKYLTALNTVAGMMGDVKIANCRRHHELSGDRLQSLSDAEWIRRRARLTCILLTTR